MCSRWTDALTASTNFTWTTSSCFHSRWNDGREFSWRHLLFTSKSNAGARVCVCSTGGLASRWWPSHFKGDVRCGHWSDPEFWWNGGWRIHVSSLNNFQSFLPPPPFFNAVMQQLFGLVFTAEPTKTTVCFFPSAAASSSSFLGYTRFASCRRLWPSLSTRGESVCRESTLSLWVVFGLSNMLGF